MSESSPSAARDYPDAPWRMHGFALLRSFLVPTDALELPASLQPVAVAGRTTGALIYVRYLEPSPLVYHELLWAPALVRAPSGEVGLYIAAIYVDDERSLRAGRDIWALPKALARFETEGGAEHPDQNQGRVRMRADDGTSIDLSFRGFGPARLPVPPFITTLQTRAGNVERVVGTGSGRTGLASLEVPHFASEQDSWAGFIEAKPMPAMRLSSFELTLPAPEVLGGK
jgi:hypothetical protein